jgi:hypothetical protein
MRSIKLKNLLIALFFSVMQLSFAQENERISTVDFVQIVANNREEALFYYEYNWKALRAIALKKNYIVSYEIMETQCSEDAPFHLMLITTYANKAQYDQREKHFQELIKEKGKLLLLNDKQPREFRKNLFHKENVTHQSKEILFRKN